MAILGVAAVTVSFQMKDLLKSHHFNQNMEHFLNDVKKCQLIALSDRVDIEMRIEKKGETFAYRLHCDDPIPCFVTKPMKMLGVAKIQKNQKQIDRYDLTMYSSGRIAPLDEIAFFQDENQGVIFQFNKTPQVELKRIDRRVE